MISRCVRPVLMKWIIGAILCVSPAIVALGCGKPAQPIPVIDAGDLPAPDGKVHLAVLVIFDQLRGDYLERWGDLFGAGGFRRLEDEGAWFTNCHYPYAVTKTGPGHASILTGCFPDRHGIITNEWFDRAAGKYAYCVGSDRYDLVPAGTQKSNDEKRLDTGLGIAPERLLAPTLGEALKQANDGKPRVVSLSFKDRSAVLPAGAHPDACYWFDTITGQFITSTYYRDRLHSWVEEFNRGRYADSWHGKEWTPLDPSLDYRQRSGTRLPLDEDVRHFPHRLSAGVGKPDGGYYRNLYATPFGNQLLLELTKKAIDGMELGRHAEPDLLCVSFSCNDPVGHIFGPDSPEVLDITLQSDRIVKELLEYLDARVGKGRYAVALTADHGICPLPEESRALGEQAGRVSPLLLSSEAEDFLRQTFGTPDDKARWLEGRAEPWVYLNQDLLKARNLKPADVETALAQWYRKQPGVHAAYTRSQLEEIADDDAIGQSVRRSSHRERSGDVILILKPYCLWGTNLTRGTTHGTPHAYDTHVPLLVLGPGIQPGKHKERVVPQAATPIFAKLLGIDPPKSNVVPAPQSLK